MVFKLQNKTLYAAAFFMLAAYVLPYWILGGNGHFMVWDNMDSLMPWMKVATQDKYIFSPSQSVLDELSFARRSSIQGEIDLNFWIVYIFGSLYGYIIQRTLIVLTAFSGMYLLLRNHINIKQDYENNIINVGVAVAFGTLPFWPFGLFSVAGLPFLTFAFINLYKGQHKIQSYLILGLIPFYSSLILAGFFFLFILSIIWVIDSFQNRKIKLPVFFGLVILSALYVLTSYRLFETFLFDNSYLSHRLEYNLSRTWRETYLEFKDLLFGPGMAHVYSLKEVFIVPVVFLSLLITIERGLFWRQKLLIWIILIILITSIINSILYFGVLKSIMTVNRFDWLHPCLWYVLFAISLRIVCDFFVQRGIYIIIAILLLQIAYNFRMHEFIKNLSTPSFNEYFAQEQFSRIKSFIGGNSTNYKVGSVGLNPTIALFNGFNCVDSYLADYSLPYKARFRKVVAEEFKRDPIFGKNFDVWGCRLYLFSSKLGSDLGHSSKIRGIGKMPVPVYFDLEALQNLGCDYLFSAYQLNFKDNSVKPKLIGLFKDENSAWDVYLYKIPVSIQKLKSRI